MSIAFAPLPPNPTCPDPFAYFRDQPLKCVSRSVNGWFRLYPSAFANRPLGFNAAAPSRFSDPAKDYGVVYLTESFDTAFREVILRDRNAGGCEMIPLDRSDVEARVLVAINSNSDLNLVDLTDDPLYRLGVPTDACMAQAHDCGKKWSRALHDHADAPDGILYPSRLNPRTSNIVVFERGLHKLSPVADPIPIREVPEYPDLLDRYRVAWM